MDKLDWSQVDPREIPSDLVFKSPVVNELSNSFIASFGKDIPFPYIIKDKVLMSGGVWNTYYYSNATIEDAFEHTDWQDRTIRNLFLDHEDLRASEWVGEVTNIHMDGNSLKGDLVICDPVIAAKLAVGKPKVGISPKVKGDVDGDSKSMKSFTFQNFSIVMNPAVKTAYINNMEVQNPMADEEKKEDEVPEETQEEKKETPKPVEDEQKDEEEDPEDEEDKKYPKPEKEMDEELSAYTEYMKKMRAKNPEMSFSKIAAAWKKDKGKNSELEEIKSQLGELMSLLKAKETESKMEKEEDKKPEEEEPKEKDDKMSEITKKLSELELKIEKPDKLSVKGAGRAAELMDSDEGMYKYLMGLDGGKSI